MLKTSCRLALSAVLLALAGPAMAEHACAPKPVRATGSTSVLESAARSKARTAWIRKVGVHKKLGPAYAAWLRAQQPTYTCSRLGKRFVCEAKAIPCRS
jgi:hypothetical protein